jgi:hypothetical protein
MTTSYVSPELTILGSLRELTLSSGNSGNDPCRDIQGFNKQTGPSDFQIGNQSNLTTCSP